jgi:hypothetical protein
MRVLGQQTLEHRQPRQLDCIAVPLGRFSVFVADTPPVANN